MAGEGDGFVGVSAKREMRPCVRAVGLKFEPGKGGCSIGKNGEEKSWPAAWNERDRFRLLYFFLMLSKLPPHCKCWKPVFIGKKYCQVFKIGPLTFFFFVKFDFSCFFVFF